MPSNNEIRNTAKLTAQGLTDLTEEYNLTAKEGELFIKEVIKELKGYLKYYQ